MVSAITALQASLSSGTSSASVRLEPGTEARAKVEASLPNNVLRLSVGGSTIEVRANAALPAGTELTLKVSGDPGKPQIQLVPDGKGGVQANAGQGPSTDAATAQKLVQVAAKPDLPSAPTSSSSPAAATALADAVTEAATGKVRTVQTQASQTQTAQSSTQTHAAQTGAPRANAGQVISGQTGGAQAPTASAAQAAGDAAAQAVRQSVSQTVARTIPQASQTAAQPPAQTPATSGSPAPAAASQPSAAAGAQVIPPTASSPGAPAPALPGNLQLQTVSGSPVPPTPPTPGQALAQTLAPTGAQTGVPTGVPTGAPTQAPAAGSGQAPVNPAAGQVAGPSVGQPASPSGQAPATVQAVAQGATPSVASSAGQAAPPQVPAGGQAPIAPGGQTPGGQAPGGQAPAAPSAPANRQPAGPAPGVGAAPAKPASAALAGTPPQTAASLSSAPAGGAVPSATSFSPVSGSGATAHFVNTLPEGASGTRATVPGNAYVAAGRPPAGQALVSPQNRPVTPELKQAAEAVLPKLAEQQASLSGLYAQISAVAEGRTAATVSQPVKQVMEQILGLRLQPDAAGFSGKSIEAAVKNSGLFREAAAGGGTGQAGAQGAAQAGQTGGDLKSLLINMRTLLQGLGAQAGPGRPFTQPAAPSLRRSPQGDKPADISSSVADGDEKSVLNRLMRDTDAALSRIRLSQMVSRGLGGDEQAHHGRAMDVTMDLPIAVNGQTAIVQMQVGRDPEGTQGDDEEGPGWRLRFALDLTETGPMEAAVSLRGGGTYVSLWVDRGETLERLKADRDTLEASFAHAGIELKELRFLRGLPQRTEARFGAVVDRQS